MRYCVLILLLSGSLSVFGQQRDLTDSTEFRYGLPITSDDTTRQIRTDEDVANRWVPVDARSIPRQLKRILNKKEIYEGWERGQIYYDKTIDQYLIRIRERNAIRTYGFSAEGAAVSFAEENILSSDSAY